MSSPISLLNHVVNALSDDQLKGTYVLLPPPAASGLVTPAVVTLGAAWADGTTDEIDDGTGVTEDMWIDGIHLTLSATVGTSGEIDIGIGAAGSETWLDTVGWKASEGVNATQHTFVQISPPIFVPSGTRIAQRGRGSAATAMSTVLQLRTGMKP